MTLIAGDALMNGRERKACPPVVFRRQPCGTEGRPGVTLGARESRQCAGCKIPGMRIGMAALAVISTPSRIRSPERVVRLLRGAEIGMAAPATHLVVRRRKGKSSHRMQRGVHRRVATAERPVCCGMAVFAGFGSLAADRR